MNIKLTTAFHIQEKQLQLTGMADPEAQQKWHTPQLPAYGMPKMLLSPAKGWKC